MTDPARPTASRASGVILDLPTARRWAVTAAAMLAHERARLDALNVFPVPDADTGTNLLLTLEGGLRHMRREESSGRVFTLVEGLDVLARGTLHSARGNSGVLLSQLVRGLRRALADVDTAADAGAVAAAFDAAATAARHSVARPVEGTMLSVAEAASLAATRAAQVPGAGVGDVVDAALVAAREALHRTPDQLPALAQAGVVDAGGAGLVVVLEALAHVLGGGTPAGAAEARGTWWRAPAQGGIDSGTTVPAQAGPGDLADATDDDVTGPADNEAESTQSQVEVMYLLEQATSDGVTGLRARLDALGDSVVVAGDEQRWQVHVHVRAEEASSAIDAGLLAGRVSRVRVHDLRDAHTHAHDPEEVEHAEPHPRGRDQDADPPGPGSLGLVVCAPGPGVADLLGQTGAVVVASDAARRASIGQLMSAVWATGAQRVLVLANDATTRDALQAAVLDDDAWRTEGQGPLVRVLSSASAVQGLAAAAVFDPATHRADDDALERVAADMETAIAATRHGSVARAARAGQTPAGPCLEGQALGLVGAEVVAVADDPTDALGRVLTALVHPGATDGPPGRADLLTVLVGTTGSLEAAEAAAERVRGSSDLEVLVVPGGQPTFAYLVGAES